MPEELNSSPSADAQRAPDETAQRATPTEDAASQREKAGEVLDPDKKKLHEEAASYRKRAKDLEAQLKNFQDAEQAKKDADLSVAQKIEKRAIEAEQQRDQYKQRLVTAEVKLIAKAQRFHSPEIAAQLVKDQLEFGEDGMPINTEKALEALGKANPFLLIPAEPETPSPATTPKPPTIPVQYPGRSNTVSQNTLPPGKVSWDQVYKRP